MRLDNAPDWQGTRSLGVTVDETNAWDRPAWCVGMGDHDVAIYTTRREAERHAARIRRALKGER